MPPADRASLRQLGAKLGFYSSAFAVFACGWLAMRSGDMKRVVLFSALALVAGALASAFSRRAR